MQHVLVTGGAGYVGSHVVRALCEKGRSPVVLDDLSTGHRAAVGPVELVRADVADERALEAIFSRHDVHHVVHMAASCEVGESVADPAKYYEQNLARGLRLLEAARRHGVRGFVFSSTAAVYGEPEEIPIPEGHPTRPTNPYGETKRAFEQALEWYRRAYGLEYVVLRYFNAAGAHPAGDIGEDHGPESHLIPRLLQAALPGGEPTPIFGSDYATADGTCVRDYVHVADLAAAHVAALDSLVRGGAQARVLNLGNGEGFSVRDVVAAVERVTGTKARVRTEARRPGDPARLVASSARARAVLGWRPVIADLDSIVRTAWHWHRTHPEGYADRPPDRASG